MHYGAVAVCSLQIHTGYSERVELYCVPNLVRGLRVGRNWFFPSVSDIKLPIGGHREIKLGSELNGSMAALDLESQDYTLQIG